MYLYVTKARMSVNGQISFVSLSLLWFHTTGFASLSGQNQFDCPPECSCLDPKSTVYVKWIPYGVILKGGRGIHDQRSIAGQVGVWLVSAVLSHIMYNQRQKQFQTIYVLLLWAHNCTVKLIYAHVSVCNSDSNYMYSTWCVSVILFTTSFALQRKEGGRWSS